MSDEEHAVYEKVSSGMLSAGSEERNFSKRLHDLQRFIDRAYEEDDELVELSRAYGASTYSTKEDVLVDTLKAALAKDYSLIVYTSYKDTVERLNSVLKSRRIELGLGRIYNITGAVNQKDREKVEDKINKNDVVIITSAGTESINLQKCNCVIFYDIPFSSKEIIQCIGRITRVDTKHPTQYIIFCGVNDSIDEYKYALFQMHLGVIQRAINVGTNIPLSDMGIDAELVKELREKLLWKYKDPIKKKIRKNKRQVKSKIRTATLLEAESLISSNKFLIEPIDTYNPDIKQVKVLYPDEEKYKDFIDGKVPFPVLRSNYLDSLRTERGKSLIKKMQDGVLASADGVVLVGNTKLPEVLMQEILDQFDV
jgi:superfamily II DNA/RNA helicase